MEKNIEAFGGTIRFKNLMKQLVKNITILTTYVKEMINSSIGALLEDNEEEYLILEKKLDDVHLYMEKLDNSVMNSIALHQPFASDLRFLISSLKISNEVHRCAHNAVHIAQSSKFIERNMKCYAVVIEEIGSLARKALIMYETSVTAFLMRKALDSDRWVELDDEIDSLHEKIITDIRKIMSDDCKNINAGTSLILATRYIERIADHACNIVEESTYVVTSKREKIT